MASKMVKMSGVSRAAPFAARLARQGTPFVLTFRYRGTTEKGNPSNKWWRVRYTGEGSGSTFSCTWGKAGTTGNQTNPKFYDISRLWNKIEEKVRKDYAFMRGESHFRQDIPDPLSSCPFDNIAEVRAEVSGPWKAFDGSGNFLMLLTPAKGAELQRTLGARA